jgi:predicted DNA-binding transcriptional regulator AlpA
MARPIQDLLTPEDVAALTRTPIGTLKWWRHLGDRGPRSFKLGRRVVYARDDVLAWIKEERAKQDGGAA